VPTVQMRDLQMPQVAAAVLQVMAFKETAALA
jgi:hypothetical protein